MDVNAALRHLFENNYICKKINKNVPYGQLISESGLNRLRTHLANGGIIVSANITDFPEDTATAIWTVYDEWLDKNALSDSVKNRINFLKIHNRNADKALEEEIKTAILAIQKYTADIMAQTASMILMSHLS